MKLRFLPLLLLLPTTLACEEKHDDSCDYAFDGICDEGGACSQGTDSTDCGYSPDDGGGDTSDQCAETTYPSDSGGTAEVCTQGPCSQFSAGTPQGTCRTNDITLCCALGGSSAGITVRYYGSCGTSVCDAGQDEANWTSVCDGYSGTLYRGDCSSGSVVSGGSGSGGGGSTDPGTGGSSGGTSTSGGACVTAFNDGSYACAYVLSSSDCPSGDFWSGYDCSSVQQNY